MRTWSLGPALALLLFCACDLTQPVDTVQQPDDPSKEVVYSCPDDDHDGFSRVNLCGPQDCNDQNNFSLPDQGYCPEFSYLEFDPPDGWLAADFALLQDSQTYHLFYMKGPFWQQYPDKDGQAFGHATTEDGLSWIGLDDAFEVAPDSDWDDAFIWSPCIVLDPKSHRYFMFYTGVTIGPDGHEERIGVATSPNLKSWRRQAINECEGKTSAGCLWEPTFAWSAWSEVGAWTKQCRDPWVYWDEVSACWYMVYSTVTAPFDYTMVLGLAKSDDLLHWADCGPLTVTAGHLAESATMIRVDGLVHLFWTSLASGGISHATTSDPETGPWSAPVLLAGSVENRQVAAEFLQQDGWYIYSYVMDPTRNIYLKSTVFAGAAAPVPKPVANLTCHYTPAALVYPGAIETPNGVDDNCNGLVDEGTGPCVDLDGDYYGDPASIYCTGLGLDCDDADAAIHPMAVGSCTNGIDDNCNGQIDEPTECLPKFPVLTTRY